MLSLLPERFSICSCCPTGPTEGDRQAGSVAADCSQGREPSGHAGSVCYPVELLSAPFAAQPQETHQGTSAQCGPSTGRHAKVSSFFKFTMIHDYVCMSEGFAVCFIHALPHTYFWLSLLVLHRNVLKKNRLQPYLTFKKSTFNKIKDILSGLYSAFSKYWCQWFLCEIADEINWIKNVLLWLYMFSHNVLPTTVLIGNIGNVKIDSL